VKQQFYFAQIGLYLKPSVHKTVFDQTELSFAHPGRKILSFFYNHPDTIHDLSGYSPRREAVLRLSIRITRISRWGDRVGSREIDPDVFEPEACFPLGPTRRTALYRALSRAFRKPPGRAQAPERRKNRDSEKIRPSFARFVDDRRRTEDPVTFGWVEAGNPIRKRRREAAAT
jgi:hypothetical protein